MSICMTWSRSHSIFIGFLQELWWVQLGLVFDEDKCFLLATAIQVTHPQGPKSFSPGRMVKLILGYSISILNGYIIRMEVYVRTLCMKLHFILAVIVICVTLSSLLFVVDFFNLRASPHSKHFDTSFSLTPSKSLPDSSQTFLDAEKCTSWGLIRRAFFYNVIIMIT